MDKVLQTYQTYLPFVIVCSIALIVITLILVFMAGRKLMAKSARRAALAPPPGLSEYDSNYLHTKKVGFFGSIKRFFSRSNRKDADQENQNNIKRGFNRAIFLFRKYFSSQGAVYEKPWYLVIGPSGAGKSLLINALDLELPLGKPEKSAFDHPDVDWWYFENGIVLDVRGDFILEKQGTASNEDYWQSLLKNLENTRPQRPLDGVVLAIPSTELIGSNRLNSDEIKERAKIIFNKLWKLQQSLGIKVPVYVVVTKTDKVDGFISITKELPPENMQEMFGWSCPYTISTGFSSSWINEIFNQMKKSIDKIRLSIFAHGAVNDERDGIMLFPLEFKLLKENLSNYLLHIFKESSYKESFFLRGVYFTGMNGDPESATSKIVFAQDLFERKIFKEPCLAQNIPRILQHQKKFIRRLTWGSTAVASVWTLGIIYNYYNLKEGSSHLLPSLKVVHKSLKEINSRGNTGLDTSLLSILRREAEKTLKAFSAVDSISTSGLFMPTSWFNFIDSYIQDSFTAAYDRVILPSIYAALSHNGQILSEPHKAYRENNIGGFYNPIESTSFKNLKHYIDVLINFELFVKKYNGLDSSQSIEDLGDLVKYLFGHQLSSHFYKETSYYKKALAKTLEKSLDLNEYKVLISKKLGHLFKMFLDEVFNLEKGYPSLIILQKNLMKFSDVAHARNLDDKDVRQTLDVAIAVADIMTTGQMSWVNEASFSPADVYEEMLVQISESKTLGPDLAQELTKVANHDFMKFRMLLAELRSSITGPFFQVQDGQFLSDPPTGLISLIDSLSALLDETFMAPMEKHELLLKVPAGKILFWDDVPLIKAAEFVDSYNQFSSQRLNAFSHNLHGVFKVISRNTVRKKVTSLIGQSQTFHDAPVMYDGFNAREITHSQVTNIANVTEYFSKLLGIFQEEGFVDHNAKIREILVEQNYDILERIEKLLQQDNPYNSENEDMLTRWDGEEMLGLSLFGVHNTGEMKNYLMAQRSRIGFLAKELAEPILAIISLGYDGHTNSPNSSKGLPLVDKWLQIIKDLQSYDTQSVTNPVKILEEFLAYKLNEISLEDGCQADISLEEGFADNNFFLSIRDRYASMIESRCELLVGFNSIEKFNRASIFFNQNLSKRYPFTEDKSPTQPIEASPEDVAAFFELYDNMSDKDRQLLISASDRKGTTKTVGDFIRHIDSVRPILLASLDKGMKKQIPGIKIDVEFRTNRNMEVGGNKIIDWAFDFGDHRIDAKDPDLKGFWSAGSPIDVSLRWAGDSDVVPIPDPRSENLNVAGPSATYRYRGRWGLIRLIRHHAIPSSTFDVTDNTSQILEFYVPTAYNPSCYQGNPTRLQDRKSDPARVYCQISLSVPEGSKDTRKKKKISIVSSKKESYLPIPVFPVEAPTIDALETVILKTNKRLKRKI